MNVTDLKLPETKIYQFEKDIIRAISKYKFKRQVSAKRDRRKFKIWYRENRRSVNYFFNEFMTALDYYGVATNTSTQKIYNKFVEFTFENSDINI